MISFLELLIHTFFPSKFSRSFLHSIPCAPEPQDKNIFALYDYHSQKGKKLIYYIKQKRDIFLSKYLAEEMYNHIQEYLSEQQLFSYYINPIIISVPLSKKQHKKRGFNQTKMIAKYFAKNIHGTYSSAVIKIKETKKQALIKNRKERFKNVQGCFKVKNIHTIQGEDIIIIDDLVTTGATLKELESTLYKNGARNVISVTIAH